MKKQCPSTYSGKADRRVVTTVFCRRNEGHTGDHRGRGAQWNNEGKKVPITHSRSPTSVLSKRHRCGNVHRGKVLVLLCKRYKGHEGNHRCGTTVWKNMKPKKEREYQKYCVYLVDLGRTKKGIYQRHVKIVGDIAFILGDNGGRSADILPAINVFEEKEAAERYLAGHGVEMWVVGQEGRADMPEMFLGKVISYVHEVYSGPRHFSRLVMRPDGTTFQGSYGLKTYSNKKQAEGDYAHRWNQKMKQAKADMVDACQTIDALAKIKPRSKRRKELVPKGKEGILV